MDDVKDEYDGMVYDEYEVLLIMCSNFKKMIFMFWFLFWFLYCKEFIKYCCCYFKLYNSGFEKVLLIWLIFKSDLGLFVLLSGGLW